jgi:hypothetical protein
MSTDYPNPTREQVQQIECPDCGMTLGKSCIRWQRSTKKWILRKSNHIGRVNAFKTLQELRG